MKVDLGFVVIQVKVGKWLSQDSVLRGESEAKENFIKQNPILQRVVEYGEADEKFQLRFSSLGGQQNKPWTSVKAMGWVAQMLNRQLGNETKLRGALWITFSLHTQQLEVGRGANRVFRQCDIE